MLWEPTQNGFSWSYSSRSSISQRYSIPGMGSPMNFKNFSVCRDGEHVNVANVSYGKEERGAHIYSVTVEDGEPVECSCPHHQHRGVRCKHIHAVASHEVVQRAIKAT